jgi:hypothetical protein
MKKKKSFVPFTEEELKMIQEAGSKSLRDIAFLLNRSLDSVRRKKWMLENPERDREKKKEYRRKLQEETLEVAKYNNSRWSKAEEEEVLNSKLPDPVLAKRLGRTISAIQVKRLRLLEEKNARRRK